VKSCSTNQSPSTNTAGSGTTTKKAIVSTRALGNSTRYAPSTPAMAPLAPTVGYTEEALRVTWIRPAIAPHSR